MKRSLALLTLLAFTSIAFAGNASAAAKKPSLKGLFAIHDNSAFIQTEPDKLIVRNLRTGSVRRASFPSNSAVDSVIRVNSHAVASVTGWSDSKLVLQVNGVGMKPRVLATVERSPACFYVDHLRVLQIDSRDTVTAIRRVGSPNGIDGSSCDVNPEQTVITKYFRNGSVVDVEIPANLKTRISRRASDLSVRGDHLLVTGSTTTVFDLSSGRVIWEGPRPSSYGGSLPARGVLWTSRDYVGPRSSRVYLLNYLTGKATTIRIPHPRAGQPCGEFTLFAGGQSLEIYNGNGRLIKKARARRNDPFQGSQSTCSANFAFVPHRTGAPELIDLSRLR